MDGRAAIRRAFTPNPFTPPPTTFAQFDSSIGTVTLTSTMMISHLFPAAAYICNNIGGGLSLSQRILNHHQYQNLPTFRWATSNDELNEFDSTKLRRKKKNKYASLSATDKLDKDPLEALIDESVSKNKDLEVQRRFKSKANRHAMLDTQTHSVPKPIFPDNKNIHPYDPSTYGFVELGKIVGAHGSSHQR